MRWDRESLKLITNVEIYRKYVLQNHGTENCKNKFENTYLVINFFFNYFYQNLELFPLYIFKKINIFPLQNHSIFNPSSKKLVQIIFQQ